MRPAKLGYRFAAAEILDPDEQQGSENGEHVFEVLVRREQTLAGVTQHFRDGLPRERHCQHDPAQRDLGRDGGKAGSRGDLGYEGADELG
jgi:hypothetical protein